MTPRYTLLSLFIACSLATSAQNTCDSVHIKSVLFDPLNADSLIQVIASNESFNSFPYPGFALLDASGDTIAKEEVNFFIMTQVDNAYKMRITQPIEDPDQLNASLALHSHFYDSLECVFTGDYHLCSPTCSNLKVSAQGYAFPNEYHEFSYEIIDDQGTTVVSGEMTIDSVNQNVSDSICLDPGAYEIYFYEDSAAQSQLVYCRLHGEWDQTGESMSNASGEIHWEFEVMKPCYDSDTTLGSHEPLFGVLQVVQRNEALEVSAESEKIVHNIQVFDINGRLVYHSDPQSQRVSIPTRFMTSGVYIIRAFAGNELHTRKVIIPPTGG